MTRSKAYLQKAKKDAALENKIQAAVQDVKTGVYKSAAAAARAYDLGPQYTTIWRRVQGKAKSCCKAHLRQQLLNGSQEKVLVEWIKYLAMTGHPLSKRTIGPKVYALCGKTPSRKWVYRFLRRNPECTLGRPVGLDPARARCFNYTTVNKHFERLQNVFDGGIPLRNIHNFDEIGCQIGGGRKDTGELYLFATREKIRYKIKSDDLELVTILETVCADGTSTVKPCFVFSGVQHMEEWYDAEDGIVIATTANGWTDDNICVKWLELSFIPAAKAHADLSKPILLIYDGHGSHVTLEMIDKARENNIILYCLPPHTTHRLQPCDVGAFSPLKRAWNKHCDHVFQTTGEPLKAQNFVQEYMAARNESFKPDTIMKAWENSGIHVGEDGPRCTPEIFTESDFAPSHSTSTQLHLPDGYPTLSHDVPITADSADLDDPDSSDNGADDSDSEDEPDDNWNVRIGPSAGTRTYVLSSQLPQSDNTECEANEQSTPSTQSGPTVSSDSDDTSGTLLPLQQCRFLYHDEPDFDCDNLENLSDDELILALKEHITKYRHQRDQARQERDEAAAHATLAALHVASLQAKLHQ